MIRWSRIHANLAEPPGELTFAHIQTAVDARMTEAADLDWKAGIPPAHPDEALAEFAKDVAAMANSGGGLLVYGIKEHSGTSEAAAVKSVDGSDQTQRRLRQALNARIRPLVTGIDMIPLTSPDGQSTVLVLAVPRSPDVPHFVGDRNSIGAPFRMGAQTDWMSEAQIARAYADRFSLRETEQARPRGMVADAGTRLDFSQGTWLVAVARPSVPAPAVRRPLPRTEIRALLEDAIQTSNTLTPNASPNIRHRPIWDLGTAVDNPRVGLRRWVIQTIGEDPDLGSSGVHVELHHDGSLALAAAAESDPTIGAGSIHQIFAPFVESFAADFTALVDSYARQLGESVPAAFRVDLLGLGPHSWAIITDYRRLPASLISSQIERVPGTIALRELTPIVSETPAPVRDVIAMQTMARSIAEDVLHQFSIDRKSVV